MADERPAKRRRFTSDIVTLKVGTDNVETFTTHAEVLKKHSPFFKAALDKKWQESQSLQIDLPEDDPDVVEAYLSWLHDGKINPPELPNSRDLTFTFLAKLYVLGEKIRDNAFCNSAIIRKHGVDDLPLEFLEDALEAATVKLPFKEYEAQFPNRWKWHKAV